MAASLNAKNGRFSGLGITTDGSWLSTEDREAEYARLVAEHCGLQHATVDAGRVEDLYRSCDTAQPYAWPFAATTKTYAEKARSHGKVLLGGQFGDILMQDSGSRLRDEFREQSLPVFAMGRIRAVIQKRSLRALGLRTLAARNRPNVLLPPIPDWIRQDVSRSPGGDSRLFLNNCLGCHSGMDPLAGAFAYYNYDEDSGRLQYTPGNVQPKYYNNDLNFPQGFRTVDDAWENRWREGQNAYLGFDASLPGSGNGAKSLGQELGRSQAFAACQVKKVFKAVCLREPENAADRAAADTITNTFRSSGYRMKQVFADTAVHCMGQ